METVESKSCAVIPAFNAAAPLRQLVPVLRKMFSDIEVIIVNDGSSDETAQVATGLGVWCIQHKRNSGKGAALRTGIAKALQLGATHIFTLDADTQHDPRDISTLRKKLSEDRLDLVIGSRMSNIDGMPLHRRLSNKITSTLISWRIGRIIPDSQCGYRLIQAQVLEGLQLRCTGFDFESELVIKAALAGYRIGFCDIETIYQKGNKSYVRVSDIFRFIRLYFRSLSWKRSSIDGSVRDVRTASLRAKQEKELRQEAV